MKPSPSSLTSERLKDLVDYDPESGIFSWKVSTNGRIKPGNVCNSYHKTHKTTYIRINIDNQRHYAQRLAWLYMTGEFPEHQVDHIDGCGTNNRWINLRLRSNIGNCRNQRMPQNNTSGHVGVHLVNATGKWVASIGVGADKAKHLGTFITKADAVEARKRAEEKYGYDKNHGSERILHGNDYLEAGDES